MIIYLKNIVNTAALVCFCFFIGLSIISLSVEEGEIFGLLGLNSSGKPPTKNCILGLLRYDSSTLEVMGEKMAAVRPISRCLPVYWFITAVNLLGDYRTLDAGMRTELYTA